MEGINGYRKGLPDHLGKMVDGSKAVEESGAVNRNVSAPTKITETERVKPSGQEQTKQNQPPFRQVARKMTESDIIDQLLKIRKQPTQQNKSLIFSMIHHGVPASEEVFDFISKMIKGKNNPKSVESAVVSYINGLGEISKSVDILTEFFSKQSNLSQNLQNLQIALSSFSEIMQNTSKLFAKGLYGGLAAIVSELDEDLKKLSKRTRDNRLQLPIIKRGGLVKDFSTFHSFLAGLAEQMADNGLKTGEAKVVYAKLEELLAEVGRFLDSLAAQSILSMNSNSYNLINDRYFFWQIPNPMVDGHSDMDILIKKDKKLAGIDTEKVKMILRFDTENLGELGVIVDINKNKIGFEFHSDRSLTRSLVRQISPDLKLRMSALNYDMVHLKTIKSKFDENKIKKYKLPTYRLDNLSRIRAEI